MVVVAVLFVAVFLTVLVCVGAGLSYFRSKQKQQIRSMLRKAEATPAEQRSEFLRPAQVEDWLAKLLRRFQSMDRLDLILEQAGKNWSGSKLITISAITSGVAMLVGLKLRVVSPAIGAPLLEP
jgi:Flp pilus assembly protein TadB